VLGAPTFTRDETRRSTPDPDPRHALAVVSDRLADWTTKPFSL